MGGYSVGTSQDNAFQFSCGFSFGYRRESERDLKIRAHKKNCAVCQSRKAERTKIEFKGDKTAEASHDFRALKNEIDDDVLLRNLGLGL